MSRRVESGEWAGEVAALAAAGFTAFDTLAGIDRGEHVEVVLRLRNPGTGEATMLSTLVDDRLDSIGDQFLGAQWRERELIEQFGIEITDCVDARPLMTRGDAPSIPPMRKEAGLVARAARPWPGADENGANRRKQRPIGVPDA